MSENILGTTVRYEGTVWVVRVVWVSPVGSGALQLLLQNKMSSRVIRVDATAVDFI